MISKKNRVVFLLILLTLLISLGLFFSKSSGVVILYFEVGYYEQETLHYALQLDGGDVRAETISVDFPYMFLENPILFHKGMTKLNLIINDSVKLQQNIFIYRNTTFLKVMVDEENKEISLAQSKNMLIYQ